MIKVSDLTHDEVNLYIKKLLGHNEVLDYHNEYKVINFIQSIEGIDITHWPQLKGQVDNWIMATLTLEDTSIVQYGYSIPNAILKVYIEKNIEKFSELIV